MPIVILEEKITLGLTGYEARVIRRVLGNMSIKAWEAVGVDGDDHRVNKRAVRRPRLVPRRVGVLLMNLEPIQVFCTHDICRAERTRILLKAASEAFGTEARTRLFAAAQVAMEDDVQVPCMLAHLIAVHK